MDNASKNATDMIASLQMQYNRGRQAAITNELVDIITGAFSLHYFLFFHISNLHILNVLSYLLQVPVLCKCHHRRGGFNTIFITRRRKLRSTFLIPADINNHPIFILP